MVSGSISPSYSEYFSPFPHGTGPLSVSQEYLALPDGAGGFKRDFSGPALLRILIWLQKLPLRGFHPLWPAFPNGSSSCLHPTAQSYNPPMALTIGVWALPISLATTLGIIVIFFSSGYLDVSVPRVSLPLTVYHAFSMVGCPIRKSTDRFVFADPRGLSQLITSFFASESQGIPHTPLFTFSYFVIP